MKRRTLMIALLPALVLLAAVRCGTVTAVSPLHRGESALAASPGGPVANVGGMNIPMPYAVARCRYGRIGDSLLLRSDGKARRGELAADGLQLRPRSDTASETYGSG